MVSVLLSAIIVSGLPFDLLFANSIRSAHAQFQVCDEPVRRFNGGHGRRPGATIVFVALRQQVQNANGNFVSTDRQVARVAGNEVMVRVQVTNDSLYDVGHVVMRHRYRQGEGSSPRMDGIASIKGAEYDSARGYFTIEHIGSNQTVEFSFRILLRGSLTADISETEMTLEDFYVLEESRRFPDRTGSIPDSRLASTQRIERVGLGGTEVSCFVGAESDVIPQPPLVNSRALLVPTPSARVVQANVQSNTASSAINAALTVTTRINKQEAMSGDRLTYTINVQNKSGETFRNILVDNRFDTRLFMVETADGALVTDAGLHWLIETLAPNEQWTARYTGFVTSQALAQNNFSNTVTLIGEQLLETPTSQLSDSAQISIVSSILMPQTGLDTFAFAWTMMQFVLGVMIAFGMYGAVMWSLLRRVR